jgi:hypothetical protein
VHFLVVLGKRKLEYEIQGLMGLSEEDPVGAVKRCSEERSWIKEDETVSDMGHTIVPATSSSSP